MIQMIERAMDNRGFSVIECLSECAEFYPDAFDPANPRKGGSFELVGEKKCDNRASGKRCEMDEARTGELWEKRINIPEDELRPDVTDELAAYKFAQLPFPRVLGLFCKRHRPTKNALEKVDR